MSLVTAHIVQSPAKSLGFFILWDYFQDSEQSVLHIYCTGR